MAVLSIADRTKVWRGIMRICSNEGIQWPDGVNKYDLYNPSTNTGIITDVDTWIDDHQGNTGDTVGFNGALPEPFRTNASLQLKTFVFVAVASMRAGEPFARKLLGEVD